jgi:hypothetical protein
MICRVCNEDKALGEYSRNTTTCKDCTESQYLEDKFGISLDDYNRMYKAQDGKCFKCGASESNERLAVDKDWETNKVEGLTCYRCNGRIDVPTHWEYSHRGLRSELKADPTVTLKTRADLLSRDVEITR